MRIITRVHARILALSHTRIFSVCRASCVCVCVCMCVDLCVCLVCGTHFSHSGVIRAGMEVARVYMRAIFIEHIGQFFFGDIP